MRTKLHVVFVLLAALALLAASCSSDDDSGDTTTTAAGEETTTTAAETTTTAGGETTTTAAAAEVPSNPDEGVTDTTIKVGFMGDLTGPTAATQLFFERGIGCYLDFVNSQGGVAGREFELISEDDQFSAETATVNFQKLVEDDNVLAIIGQGSSTIITTLDQDIRDAGVPFVGPQQTIDIQFTNPVVFSTLAHYGDQADIAVARMAEELGGGENLVVLSVGLEVASGIEWGVYIDDSVTKAGGTYLEHLSVPLGATDADAQAQRIKELVEGNGANYLALHGSPATALTVLNSMESAGVSLRTAGIFATIAENVFLEGPENASENFWGVHTYTPSNISTPGNDEMNAFVVGTACEEFAFNVNFVGGWAVSKLAVEGIKRAAGSGEISRATVVDALNGVEGLDTGGQSPPFSCTREGRHCGAAGRPYEWGGDGLVAVGEYTDWADALDLEYGLGG